MVIYRLGKMILLLFLMILIQIGGMAALKDQVELVISLRLMYKNQVIIIKNEWTGCE